MATRKKKVAKRKTTRKPLRKIPVINAIAMSLRDDVLHELKALRRDFDWIISALKPTMLNVSRDNQVPSTPDQKPTVLVTETVAGIAPTDAELLS